MTDRLGMLNIEASAPNGRRAQKQAQASKIFSAGAAVSLTVGIVASIAYSTTNETNRRAATQRAEDEAFAAQEQSIAALRAEAINLGRVQGFAEAQAQVDAASQEAQRQAARVLASTPRGEEVLSPVASAAAPPPAAVAAPSAVVLTIPAPKPAPVVQRRRARTSSATTSQSS